MALTSGFKKFIGLVCITTIVGGALIYYVRFMPKTIKSEVVEIRQLSDVQIPETQTPINTQSTRIDGVDASNMPNGSSPSTPIIPPVSNNRGLDSVINAGQKP